jgi:ankyrin repeat protein
MHLKLIKVFFIVSTLWLMVLAIKNHFPSAESNHSHDHTTENSKTEHSHHIDEQSQEKLDQLIEKESKSEFNKLPFVHQSTILIQSGKLNELKSLITQRPDLVSSINTPSKEDGRTLLTRASFGGSLSIIKYLVEELKADVNIADAEKITPLMEAVSSENSQVSTYLLSKGADIHATNKQGADALTMALSGSNDSLIKELLKRGSNPNHNWNQKNFSHLMLASRNGHSNSVKVLLEAGASINAVDINSNQAIHYASSEGFIDIVKILIKNGSDTNKKNLKGKNPKDLALENNFKEIAELLP